MDHLKETQTCQGLISCSVNEDWRYSIYFHFIEYQINDDLWSINYHDPINNDDPDDHDEYEWTIVISKWYSMSISFVHMYVRTNPMTFRELQMILMSNETNLMARF